MARAVSDASPQVAGAKTYGGDSHVVGCQGIEYPRTAIA